MSPAEQTLKTFGDLDNNNYSAVVSNINMTSSIMQFISSLVSNQSGTCINKKIIPLKNLITRSVVATRTVTNMLAAAEYLVRNNNSKIVFTEQWDRSMLTLNLIQQARENGMSTFLNGAACYLGEEMITTGTYLWTFLPPNHERIAGYFQRLIETGVLSRSLKEHEEMSSSATVQMRNRFVSKTRLKLGRYTDTIIQGLQQQLRRKLWKVFFLYGFCVLACCIGIGVESAYGLKQGLFIRDKLQKK